MSSLQDYECEKHQFVVIGAGIAGLQTGIILAQNNKDFIILEATDKIGGRIATQFLYDVLKKQFKNQSCYPKWVFNNPKVLNTPIQYGATWVSQEHQYMLKMLKQFKIKIFPQYYDGLAIYGKQPGKYEQIRSVDQHYKIFENEIQKLVDKVQILKNKQIELKNKKIKDEKSSQQYNEFIDIYDTLSVKQFIMSQISNQVLASELVNEIQTLQCISGDKISMMQLFEDDSSLQLIKFYTGKVQNQIDGMRVQNGMITLPKHMCQKMVRQARVHHPKIKQQDLLVMNSPVIKIENSSGKEIKIYIEGCKKVYTCQYIFFSVPIAVINKIQITRISKAKRLIFENQESGNVTRVYMVFEEAFWRYKYNGYGSFNHNFPFNEITELSPANLACGVLAFIFIGDKYQKWVQKYPDQQSRFEYLKNVVAELFLKGDTNSPHLKGCITYSRSFSDNPYIKAGYQATTKREIWKKIKDQGEDYVESYDKDQNNLIYIGSQFADQFSTFMEGAIRIARQKVYKLLNQPDPWRN